MLLMRVCAVTLLVNVLDISAYAPAAISQDLFYVSNGVARFGAD